MTDDPFAAHRATADAMAALLPGLVEVVLHDLARQEVVHIANNMSNRQLGDPSGLDEIAFDPAERLIGPYEKRNWDGGTIRSMTAVLRHVSGEPFGVMCINLNASVLEGARGLLDRILSGQPVIPQPDSLFRDDWQERINTFIHSWLLEHGQTVGQLNRTGKRSLVQALHASGAFEGRNAADYIARVLGMGRATIFNHLREIRGEGDP